MIHGEKGEGTFWGMVRYGQGHGDDAVCRETILRTLGEVSSEQPGSDVLAILQEQCTTTEARSVGAHCKAVVQLVSTLNQFNEDCTLNQVVKRWRTINSEFDFLKENPPSKDLSKEGESGMRCLTGVISLCQVCTSSLFCCICRLRKNRSVSTSGGCTTPQDDLQCAWRRLLSSGDLIVHGVLFLRLYW